MNLVLQDPAMTGEELSTTDPFHTKIDRKGIELTVPGFVYGDFDRNGNVAVWMLRKLDENCHQLIFNDLHLKHATQEVSNYAQVMKEALSGSHDIHITYYEANLYPGIYESGHIYHNLKLTNQLANASDTYFDLLNVYWSDEIKSLLYESLTRYVFIDKETRQQMPIPENLKQKMLRYQVSRSVDISEALSKPTSATVTYRPVYWSHVNKFSCVTLSSYIQFCYDAILEDEYVSARAEIDHLRTKKLSCLCLGDSGPGDVLAVSVWKSKSQPLEKHASVENDQQCVYQCSIEFEGSPSPKL